ncbi:MAG: glycosyltransferase family 2 protein [Thermoplasmata archaeon]|nr:glycosyltransferase family 2 protein [Thermoplasmata archaeon]
MRATLVIPALNEGEAIGHVIRGFRDAAAQANATTFAREPLDWEVLVVDGASSDGTAERAEAAGARVLVEPRRGYGRAYMTGFAAASGEIIATSDGDATYPVELIPGFVQRLLDRELDFITCNRLAHIDRRAMTTEHRIGNSLLNLLVQVAYRHLVRDLPGDGLVDSQSGMWIFRRRILDRLNLTQEGMAFSEELKLEVLLNGLRFEEVPIRYAERWGAPKLSSWKDGSRNMMFLVRKRIAVGRVAGAGSAHRRASKRALSAR